MSKYHKQLLGYLQLAFTVFQPDERAQKSFASFHLVNWVVRVNRKYLTGAGGVSPVAFQSKDLFDVSG
jgi:hypothetical protein